MSKRRKELDTTPKNRIVGGDPARLYLADGTIVEFYHEQDCYENVWADVSALQDTGFEDDLSITGDFVLRAIRMVDGYGVKIGDYGIPCYNEQNGYHNSLLHISVKLPRMDKPRIRLGLRFSSYR